MAGHLQPQLQGIWHHLLAFKPQPHTLSHLRKKIIFKEINWQFIQLKHQEIMLSFLIVYTDKKNLLIISFWIFQIILSLL